MSAHIPAKVEVCRDKVCRDKSSGCFTEQSTQKSRGLCSLLSRDAIASLAPRAEFALQGARMRIARAYLVTGQAEPAPRDPSQVKSSQGYPPHAS